MQTDIVQIQTCAILPHSIFLPLEKTIRGSIPSSLYFKHDKTEQNQDTVCFPLLLLFLLKPKKLATGTLEKCVYILSVIYFGLHLMKVKRPPGPLWFLNKLSPFWSGAGVSLSYHLHQSDFRIMKLCIFNREKANNHARLTPQQLVQAKKKVWEIKCVCMLTLKLLPHRINEFNIQPLQLC